ncbi:hypothetical protein BCR34DRAFT_603996 [Clohesyomyces aquaticus]|uniref:Uncharacterized protein n=1 Tax=Clohesyomyces aquaticus TaxID=1231657 RepID=A0A1Y1ZA90_9PLEO|nr:hypothetical protein BCR34DRAFT_603996 [Clohesyomyces aquaticus]
MRAFRRLLLSVVTHVWLVNANVEKTVFLAPPPPQLPLPLPNVLPGLDDLRIDTLLPTLNPVLATSLPVRFPSDAAPRGLESWYLLRGLEEGRRYEVRVCWPATQPTDFWLDTFTVTHVLDTPGLLSSLATYSEQRDELGGGLVLFAESHLDGIPPDVDADIILDPFILNVLPRSLGPVAIYITIAAIGAWFLSEHIYRWLLSVAAEESPKPHTD